MIRAIVRILFLPLRLVIGVFGAVILLIATGLGLNAINQDWQDLVRWTLSGRNDD